jgi:NAD(P)-dependent dehydrogenase (short-subunit alcohol dehydrogenase family)
MKDKTVVITGATSDLGRATALHLAQKGAFVVLKK